MGVAGDEEREKVRLGKRLQLCGGSGGGGGALGNRVTSRDCRDGQS